MDRRTALRVLCVLACPLSFACREADVGAPEAMDDPESAVRTDGDRVIVLVSAVREWRAVAPSQPVAVVFLSARVIVVRRSAGDYVAYSNECPHAGCGVSVVRAPTLICPCHGSTFDYTGRVLEGPATRGLTALHTTLDPTGAVLTIEPRLPVGVPTDESDSDSPTGVR